MGNINTAKERAAEIGAFKNTEEARPVYGREINNIVASLTDGTSTDLNVASAVIGSVTSASPTGGIGYSTGAGSAVTQITSTTTGVEINAVCGTITTIAGTLAAGGEEAFTVTNSAVAANDVVVVTMKSTASAGSPAPHVSATADGSFVISITNLHASAALDEALVLNFVVIKAVAA